jgi:putative ABC transport system permease protein
MVSMMIKVIGFLALLAVCIASMGLFGMVVLQRRRDYKKSVLEKCWGVNETALVYVLSKSFLLLLIIVAGVVLPLTYLFFNGVVLVNASYHPPIENTEMIVGLVGDYSSIASCYLTHSKWRGQTQAQC